MAEPEMDPEDASFETERHRVDQPVREDMLDPDDIHLADDPDEEAWLAEPLEADPTLDPELLPETQGTEPELAERWTEDTADRPPLSDEERRQG